MGTPEPHDLRRAKCAACAVHMRARRELCGPGPGALLDTRRACGAERACTFSFAQACGHGSFLFLALSYLATDVVWLRALAVAAQCAMMLFNFFHPHGRVLWLPLRYTRRALRARSGM